MSSPTPASPIQPKTGRHASPWLNRIHRKHDSTHHREQEPLLASDHPDSDTEAQESSQTRRTWPSMKPVFTFLPEQGHKVSKLSSNGVKQFWQFCKRNVKQILFSIALTSLTVVIALSFGFWTHHRTHVDNLCTSPACVHAASELLHSISPNWAKIDPCEQFDVLSCQGFEERHDLRPDQGDMFRGTIMAEDAEVTLRHILEADTSEIDPVDRQNFRKLKADYTACMDELTIKDLGLKPLKSMIRQIRNIYPVTENSGAWHNTQVLQTAAGPVRTSAKDLTEVYLYLTKLGIDPMLYIGVGADDKEPEVQIVSVFPSLIGLPSKEYYENNDTVVSYQSMISSVLPHFFDVSSNSSFLVTAPGVHISVADLAISIVGLEVKIAAAMPAEEDRNDVTKTYNKMNVAKADELLSQISISKVIEDLAPKDYEAESVIVSFPYYLTNLSEIISATPKETLQGFLVWKAIQSYASRVDDSALLPLTRFNNKLSGKEPDAKPDRWRRCIQAADGDLGWILSKFFVDKAFSPASKDFGNQIVSDIKGSFVHFLKDASWMTPDNRERAIKKVSSIDQKIGYPTSNPDILDPVALKKYYKSVTIGQDTFFDNAVEAVKFETSQQWSKLGQPTRHDEWGMTAPTVNAYYNPAGNEIVFPAGIMQSPVFYDPSVPQYLSYGAFGAVSGHELSHAFDNTGSQYDESGRFVDWWSNETRKAFDKKTSCFVDQYAKYSITDPEGKEINVNGKLTLGENVADAGGIHAAFKAWKKREEENPSKLLPGLHMFTKEQLFFINYANWWCGKTTKETAVRRIYTDPHAPKWTRILGTMANSAEFREAFKCPSKKPTCELW